MKGNLIRLDKDDEKLAGYISKWMTCDSSLQFCSMTAFKKDGSFFLKSNLDGDHDFARFDYLNHEWGNFELGSFDEVVRHVREHLNGDYREEELEECK